MSLKAALLATISCAAEGEVFSADDFQQDASRSAISAALTALCRERYLLRIDRGMYVRLLTGSSGCRAPAVESVLQSLMRRTGEQIVSTGGSAAHRLGLTGQVPAIEIRLTSGVSRVIALGKLEIQLRRIQSPWQLVLGDCPAGDAARALAWLGPESMTYGLTTVKRKLPEDQWNALVQHRDNLPSWMKSALERFLGGFLTAYDM